MNLQKLFFKNEVGLRCFVIMMLFLILLIGNNCQLINRQKAVIISAQEDPVLSFAQEELRSLFLKSNGPQIVANNESQKDVDWKIYFIVDNSMAPYSFAVSCLSDSGTQSKKIQLKGPDPTCILHAAYTMLEKAEVCFDFIDPVIPKKLNLENLIGWSTEINPAVNQRGIRLHINFAMDISSYPLSEAQEYIRNLARMRMNYIAFHSYPGQWYAFTTKKDTSRAGAFFYGQRHDIPDDPVLKNVIRNKKVYCTPEVEPYYDQPEEKSRRAIEWLQAVIQEAKRVGLKVRFSVELRRQDMEFSLATCESVKNSYPWIDVFEIISGENSGLDDKNLSMAEFRKIVMEYFDKDALNDKDVTTSLIEMGKARFPGLLKEIGHNIKVVKKLKEIWKDKKCPELCIGIYCTNSKILKPGFALMRRYVPAEISLSVMPSHGARAAVENIKAIPINANDLKRTMIYSWTEFDGLMYLQEHPVVGVYQLLEEGKRLLGNTPMFGICWNHWRTAENRTSTRYAALACIEGSIEQDKFYRNNAAVYSIGNVDEYVSAMKELDDADNFSRDNLFNIGFCWGGYWRRRGGIDNYGRYKNENIVSAIQKFESVVKEIRSCEQKTSSDVGKKYLSFLDNRISCTILHLQSFEKMSGLIPLVDKKNIKDLTNDERIQIVSVCDEALGIQKEYMKLHAEAIIDRGCEGTLISYYCGPFALLKQIRQEFSGEIEKKAPQQKTADEPPAPLEEKKKK